MNKKQKLKIIIKESDGLNTSRTCMSSGTSKKAKTLKFVGIKA